MVNKDQMKKELMEKSNNILKKFDEPYEIDSVAIMNTTESTVFLGNVRVLDENKVKKIMKEMEKDLDGYGKLNLRERRVVPCCSLPYVQVSFNIAIPK